MRPRHDWAGLAILAAAVLVAHDAYASGATGFGGFAGGITGGRLHDGGSDHSAPSDGAEGPTGVFEGRWPGGRGDLPQGLGDGGAAAHGDEPSDAERQAEQAAAADAGHRGITIGPGADPTAKPAEPATNAESSGVDAGAGRGAAVSAQSLPHDRAGAELASSYDRHYYGYQAGGEAPAVDTALATLPGGTEAVSVEDQPYYYGAGVFYRPSEAGYTVVHAPVGAQVAAIPRSAETVDGNDATYYYFDGAYYRWISPTTEGAGVYEVVEPPYGAMVSTLPGGAREELVDGSKYYVHADGYYKPFYRGGDVVYVVVINPN